MNKAGRAICEACRRPGVGCVCASLPRIAHALPVVVLQHPREARHPFGTVPLARAALEGLRVEVGLDHEPRRGALLWPSEGARPLELAAREDRPERLVVLDGTWSHARALLRRNPWLEALPRYTITPRAPGRYRTRRERSANGLATIEAIATALSQFEPELEPALDALIAAFEERERQMVAHQADPRPRRRRERVSAERAALVRQDIAVATAVVVDGRPAAWAMRRSDDFAWARVAGADVARLERHGVDGAPCVASWEEALAQLVEAARGASSVFAWRAAPFRSVEGIAIFDLKTAARRRDPSARLSCESRDVRDLLEASRALLASLSEGLVVAEVGGGEPERGEQHQPDLRHVRDALEERE